MATLARLTQLRSLALAREEVTDAGVRQLSGLAGLTRLVLRDTAEVSGDTVAVLLPALKQLQVGRAGGRGNAGQMGRGGLEVGWSCRGRWCDGCACAPLGCWRQSDSAHGRPTNLPPPVRRPQVLDLQRNWSFSNAHLARCLPALAAASSLTALDLRATWVCDEGLLALARCCSLRRLAISPQQQQHHHHAHHQHQHQHQHQHLQGQQQQQGLGQGLGQGQGQLQQPHLQQQQHQPQMAPEHWCRWVLGCLWNARKPCWGLYQIVVVLT